MAKILETTSNRRIIKMSTDDILSVISQYQNITKNAKDYFNIRNILDNNVFYLPEDF